MVCMLSGSAIALLALILPASLIPLLMFVFGACALPIYAVSLALANDNARDGKFIELGTGLLMLNALGSIIGPMIASQLMTRFGPQLFFGYHMVVLLLGSLLILFMIRTKQASLNQGDFTLATTAAAQASFQLDPRVEVEESDSVEDVGDDLDPDPGSATEEDI
jgi:MFS family permease